MENYATWAIAAAAGYLIGMMYFGGLWWTVRRLADSPRPALVLAISYFVRTALLFVGFYLALGDHWLRLIFCFGGFLIARQQWMRKTRRSLEAMTR